MLEMENEKLSMNNNTYFFELFYFYYFLFVSKEINAGGEGKERLKFSLVLLSLFGKKKRSLATLSLHLIIKILSNYFLSPFFCWFPHTHTHTHKRRVKHGEAK